LRVKLAEISKRRWNNNSGLQIDDTHPNFLVG